LNAVEDPLDRFVEILELLLDAADGFDGGAEHQVNRILHDLGQPIGGAGSLLNAAGDPLGIGETIASLVPQIVGQIGHVHLGDVIEAELLGEHLHERMAKHGAVDLGCKRIALVEQVLQEVLLLASQVMDQVETHAREALKGDILLLHDDGGRQAAEAHWY